MEDQTPNSLPAGSRWPWLAVLACLVLAVHGQALLHSFTAYDDGLHILDNPIVASPSWGGLAEAWRGPVSRLFIPVTYSAWAAVSAMAGLKPAAFHGLNLVLHLGSVFLVLSILRRLTGSLPAAAAGAALFAIHPLQAEAVAWASEAKGLLAALLSLAAIRMHLSRGAHSGREGRRWFPTAATAGLVLLALLAKPSAAAVPLVLLVLDLLVLGRPWRRAALELLPLGMAALAAAAVTGAVQGQAPGFKAAPLLLRPLIAWDALSFYLAKLFWPHPLAIDYGRTPEALLSWQAEAYWVWILPLAMLVVAWRLRPLRLPLALFVAGLAPVLGLASFEFQFLSTVADRYAYLAMLGPALALAMLPVWPRKGTGPGGRAAVAALLALLAVTCWHQVRIWHDDFSLNAQALAVTPRSFLAKANLGLAQSAAGRLAEAEASWREALALRPGYAEARLNLGNLLLRTGRPAEAAQEFMTALISFQPGQDQAGAMLGLGTALGRTGRLAEAEKVLRELVRLKPLLAEARFNLGNVLAVSGRPEEAAASYRGYLALAGHQPEAWLNVGDALVRLGLEEGVACWRRALSMRPGYPEAMARLANSGAAR